MTKSVMPCALCGKQYWVRNLNDYGVCWTCRKDKPVSYQYFIEAIEEEHDES